MIKYKRLLGAINIVAFVLVFSYCLSQIAITPLTFIISITASLTSLILVNLLYFDLEEPISSLIEHERSREQVRESSAEQSLNN